MNFEAIENLSAEELASLYDDVIEGEINVAQCACGTDGTCSYNGSKNSDNTCIAFTLNGTQNYISEENCRTFCKKNCDTDYILYWGYVQSRCNDNYYLQNHNPCTKNSGDSYILFCR